VIIGTREEKVLRRLNESLQRGRAAIRRVRARVAEQKENPRGKS
jgi:hypothetical protein